MFLVLILGLMSSIGIANSYEGFNMGIGDGDSANDTYARKLADSGESDQFEKDTELDNSDQNTLQGESEDDKDIAENNDLRQPFDIDRFLTELDAFECKRRRRNEIKEDDSDSEYDSLCANEIKDAAFMPLGDFNANAHDFYSYLNDNIYSPLAYKVRKRDTLSDLLKDLIFINEDYATIGDDSPEITYEDFESKVLDKFAHVQSLTSDMDKHHDTISDLTVELLKKFHVYWNTLRSKGRADEIKADTRKIMRNLLKEYEVQEKFLYEVTQLFVKRVKDSYGKFLKAHHTINLLNTEGPYILAKRFIDRYLTVMNSIKTGGFSMIMLVKQLSALLEIQQGYYVLNYRLKFSEPQNIHHYYRDIYNKIEPLYLETIQSVQDNEHVKTLIKHFTSTLMLKMKYTEHFIFYYNGISLFVNFGRTSIDSLSKITVKIYHHISNSLLLVPKICANILTLKQCALNEINKVLRQVGITYSLKRSTGGWGIFTYLHDNLKHLFSKSDETVFANWTIFKSYYYQNLFSVMQNIKQRFYIKDHKCIEELEDQLGNDIEHFKAHYASHYINFGLIDQLDIYLFKKMLSIKAELNRLDDVNRDVSLLMHVRNNLYKYFAKFENKYQAEINEDFHELIEMMKRTIEKWRVQTVRSPSVSIQVSQAPLHTMNMYPQIYHNVIGPDSKEDFNVPISLTSDRNKETNAQQTSQQDNTDKLKYNFAHKYSDKDIKTTTEEDILYSNGIRPQINTLEKHTNADKQNIQTSLNQLNYKDERGNTENRRLNGVIPGTAILKDNPISGKTQASLSNINGITNRKEHLTSMSDKFLNRDQHSGYVNDDNVPLIFHTKGDSTSTASSNNSIKEN